VNNGGCLWRGRDDLRVSSIGLLLFVRCGDEVKIRPRRPAARSGILAVSIRSRGMRRDDGGVRRVMRLSFNGPDQSFSKL